VDEWASAAELAGLSPTASELRELGMRAWPKTQQGINARAKKWQCEGRQQGSSQAWEYLRSSLPAPVRKVMARALLKTASAVPAPLPALAKIPVNTADLKNYQRTTMEARAAILAEVDRLVITAGVGRSNAVKTLVEMARDGTLAPELARLVPIANARGNASRSLCRSTVYGWLATRSLADGDTGALAPVAIREAPVRGWTRTFMDCYCIPQKPTIAEVLDRRWPEGVEKPSYDQARRFVKKLGTVTRNKGRMGPRALQAYKAYVTRDVSDLWPGACFIGDGHTFKREVSNPKTGLPFRPEVTAILDVFTKVWAGWSVALSENTIAVADALRHAITSTTCCAIFYYDNGKGANNKKWDDDITGMMGRLAITKLNSAPWTSQSRGIIERFNGSVLHRLARQAPTYVGQHMDKEARDRAYKITRKQIKETGSSALLTSWADFMAELEAEQLRYNATPHSSHPEIIDQATGKRRHMSPQEVWDKAVAAGWTADPISAEEATDLFRPAEIRTVLRCQIELYNNLYFHPALEELHKEKVSVAFDIHDAAKVQIRLLDGRFVCEAVFEGNKKGYFPKSYAEQAEERRVAGQVKLLEGHIGRVKQALGPLPIEHLPEVPLTFDQQQAVEAEFARLEAREAVASAPTPAAGIRPNFHDDVSWARWVLEHPQEALDQDRNHLKRKLRDRIFMELLEMQGLDVGALSALAA